MKAVPAVDNTLIGAGYLGASPGSEQWAIAVRLELQGYLSEQESNVKHLENMLSMMKEREGWRHLKAADGTPFRSYDHFTKEKQPFGLGTRAEKIEEIIALRKRGRPTKEEEVEKGSIRTFNRGANTQYWLARLKRDRPDILEALNRGEYRNPYQAAIAAGFVKVAVTLQKAQNAFLKLSKDERETFLIWVSEQGSA